MRLVPVLLLLAASPSTVSVGCTPRSQRPDPDDVARVELHSWSSGKQGEHYWVTQFEPGSGCVATETIDDGIVNIVRDCSIPTLIRPRLAELIALFELDPKPQRVFKRLAVGGGEGHGIVFERGDGTRWTSRESKLLQVGAELLDRDAAEWLLIGPPPSTLPPTPEGWTQLTVADREQTRERTLDSDGRWTCESWRMSEQSLEHSIVIHRGRLAPERAAKLLDSFADGLSEAGPNTSEWRATMQRLEPSASVELYGDTLTERWNDIADALDDECRL